MAAPDPYRQDLDRVCYPVESNWTAQEAECMAKKKKRHLPTGPIVDLDQAAQEIRSRFRDRWPAYQKGMAKYYRRITGTQDGDKIVRDLRSFGVEISSGQGRVIRENCRSERRRGYRDLSLYGQEYGFDDTFAFIAGYTSGGAPYGTTWEELERERDYEARWSMEPDEEAAGLSREDLPFDEDELLPDGIFTEEDIWPEDGQERWERLLNEAEAYGEGPAGQARLQETPRPDSPLTGALLPETYGLLYTADLAGLSSLFLSDARCFLALSEGKALLACPQSLLDPDALFRAGLTAFVDTSLSPKKRPPSSRKEFLALRVERPRFLGSEALPCLAPVLAGCTSCLFHFSGAGFDCFLFPAEEKEAACRALARLRAFHWRAEEEP